MRRVVLGTAGHIDHGKTALVRALTGVDTDRLPEEKRRGITIDLGFAGLALGAGLHLDIVDVPGHEAFVRNMLAGATGIDLVLLVVAADEGVMPQTREHAAIIDLLGVGRGVVAITKADLADEDWLDLVCDDVRELLRGSSLDGAPLVPVSARTGGGLDALKQALATSAAAVRPRDDRDLFRMPIDRVFTVRGTGTVVTGTVWSGSLRRDAQVRVGADGPVARVRGLQRHGAACDEVRAGERAAVALAGLDRQQAGRGDWLLQGEAWTATGMLTVTLAALEDAAPLAARQRVRISVGTAEVLARLALPDGPVAPGATALAQLRLETPLVTRAGDRFVIRSYSPVRTIGGGVVLEPHAARRKRLQHPARAMLERLAGVFTGREGEGTDAAVVAGLLDLAGDRGLSLRSLPVASGIPPWRLERVLAGVAPVRLGDLLLPQEMVAAARGEILQQLRAFHDRQPIIEGMDKDTLRRAVSAGDHAFTAALDAALADGSVLPRGSAVALASHRTAPAAAQLPLLDALAELYRVAALQPPDLDELPAALQRADTPLLLRHLERTGVLVRLTPTRWCSAAAVAGAVSALSIQVGDGQAFDIADFRQVVNLSRKHMIPLLEYLDRVGVTARDGERRRLVRTADTIVFEAAE